MTIPAAAGSPTLELRGARIEAGGRVLFHRLDLAINAGECWCVLGPNGSGKSTLLHTFAGLLAPAAGSLVLLGMPWAQWDPRAAARSRALLLQHRSDAFSASVLETVATGRHPHIGRFGWAGEDDERRIGAALGRMDLVHLADRDVLTLSGGERQRVALAAVLAQDPSVFLLDEPSAHLDLAHQAALFAHLTALVRTEGRTVAFSTHDVNLAVRFASHALLLGTNGEAAAGRAESVLEPERLSRLFAFPLERAQSSRASGFVPRW